MTKHILYAYVDGADLDDVAATLEERLNAFVASRQWIAGAVSVVNQRQDDESSAEAGDLPLWDSGLNLELPDQGAEPPGWFTDVKAIVEFLPILHRECGGREFVVGIGDTETGIAEDLYFVSTDPPDLKELRDIIDGHGKC